MSNQKPLFSDHFVKLVDFAGVLGFLQESGDFFRGVRYETFVRRCMPLSAG